MLHFSFVGRLWIRDSRPDWGPQLASSPSSPRPAAPNPDGTTTYSVDVTFPGNQDTAPLTYTFQFHAVDVTHAVPPGDVRAGAYLLGRAWHRFPQGTVHLAVVDPGVGTGRAALAVAAHGHYFVGPDNGLFTLVLRDAEVQIVVLPTPDGAAPTFHGRDVFAPAAAALAAGAPLGELGPPFGGVTVRLA